MSRVGKKPIELPSADLVKIQGNTVIVGKKGEMRRTLAAGISARIEENTLYIERAGDHREARALHGLERTLIANMIEGVTRGFRKELEIRGVGYRATLKGKALVLNLGYSHPVEYTIPDGITIEVGKPTEITVCGQDKQLVGQTAANIRAFRKVEPYKGKGIRYKDEHVRRKVGKVGA